MRTVSVPRSYVQSHLHLPRLRGKVWSPRLPESICTRIQKVGLRGFLELSLPNWCVKSQENMKGESIFASIRSSLRLQDPLQTLLTPLNLRAA